MFYELSVDYLRNLVGDASTSRTHTVITACYLKENNYSN